MLEGFAEQGGEECGGVVERHLLVVEGEREENAGEDVVVVEECGGSTNLCVCVRVCVRVGGCMRVV